MNSQHTSISALVKFLLYLILKLSRSSPASSNPGVIEPRRVHAIILNPVQLSSPSLASIRRGRSAAITSLSSWNFCFSDSATLIHRLLSEYAVSVAVRDSVFKLNGWGLHLQGFSGGETKRFSVYMVYVQER